LFVHDDLRAERGNLRAEMVSSRRCRRRRIWGNRWGSWRVRRRFCDG
jgi:hypothetical protein